MHERPGSALALAAGFLGLVLLSCDPIRNQGQQTVAGEPVTITVLIPDADARALGPQFDGPRKLLVFKPLATGGSNGSTEGRPQHHRPPPHLSAASGTHRALTIPFLIQLRV